MIVSLVTEGLVARGHDVTLFASGDSETRAKLVSIYPQALGNDGTKKGNALWPLLHYIECFRRQDEFDLIHSHAQYLGLFLADFARVPIVHTWHGSYYPDEAPEDKRAVLATFPQAALISISNNQRGGMPTLNYIDTVYNGIDIGKYAFVKEPQGNYLLWVGRIVEKKGPLEAIEVAKKLQIPLKLVAAIDPIDRQYFEQVISPHIDGKLITHYGQLSRAEVADLYGNALATLFPISWHEPFGLVMVESMACGTPVIAYNIGSAAEVVNDGETGFIIDDGKSGRGGDWKIKKKGIEGLIEAVKRIREIDRASCRTRVEREFTSDIMVDRYTKVYERMIHQKGARL